MKIERYVYIGKYLTSPDGSVTLSSFGKTVMGIESKTTGNETPTIPAIDFPNTPGIKYVYLTSSEVVLLLATMCHYSEDEALELLAKDDFGIQMHFTGSCELKTFKEVINLKQ